MMEHVLADSSLAAPPVAPHGAEAVDAGEYRAYFDDALERISKLQHSNNEDIVALRAQLEQEREDALRQRDERHAVVLAALETRAAAAEADAKLLRSQLERLRAEDTELAGLTRAQSAAARVLRAPGMLQALLGAVAGQGPGAVSAQIRAEGARVLYALLRSEVQVQAASRPAARAPARGSGGRRAEGVARASLEVIKVTLIWAGGRGGAGAGGAGGGGADGRGRGVARGALAQHGRRRAHGEPRAAP